MGARPDDVPEVLTRRLRLRGWSDDDLEPLVRLNENPRVARYLRGGRPITRADTEELFSSWRAHWREHGFGYWVVEHQRRGEFLGVCGLALPEFLPEMMPCVQIGWRVRPKRWGRGYATEAAAASLRFAFADLGIARVVAIIDPGNAPSIRVAEKLGMWLHHETTHPRFGYPLLVYEIERTPADGFGRLGRAYRWSAFRMGRSEPGS